MKRLNSSRSTASAPPAGATIIASHKNEKRTAHPLSANRQHFQTLSAQRITAHEFREIWTRMCGCLMIRLHIDKVNGNTEQSCLPNNAACGPAPMIRKRFVIRYCSPSRILLSHHPFCFAWFSCSFVDLRFSSDSRRCCTSGTCVRGIACSPCNCHTSRMSYRHRQIPTDKRTLWIAAFYPKHKTCSSDASESF